MSVVEDPQRVPTDEELLEFFGRPTTGADVTKDEVAAFLRVGHDKHTEGRVLGWISRILGRARDADAQLAEVVILREPQKRSTKWAVACMACTAVAPKLEATKRAAYLAAMAHLGREHASIGVVTVEPS